jgi:hypothetical protein
MSVRVEPTVDKAAKRSEKRKKPFKKGMNVLKGTLKESRNQIYSIGVIVWAVELDQANKLISGTSRDNRILRDVSANFSYGVNSLVILKRRSVEKNLPVNLKRNERLIHRRGRKVQTREANNFRARKEILSVKARKIAGNQVKMLGSARM